MGRDLYDSFETARSVFEQADEALEFPLSHVCFEGPEEELKQTINAQPALACVSFACLKVAQEVTNGTLPSPGFVAGHSLGEYTALAAAGVLDFPSTVKLARERGRLMWEAGLTTPGGMVAIIGLDEEKLAEVCADTNTWIANINCPGQLVLSGARENLPRAADLAKARGAARAIPLQVSGAFHTPLMKPAVDGMAEIMATLAFSKPSVPIVANTSAQPLTSAELIKEELLRQLCNAVQWQRSVEFMANNGVTTFLEIGPGKVLAGLIKRISRSADVINLGDVQSIRALVPKD
ncbi:MAG: ACP S-malonyltransferase [Chloroflexi bacterium]|nr:ACP S-malonyltransferase [Chloroflexota bacterium]